MNPLVRMILWPITKKYRTLEISEPIKSIRNNLKKPGTYDPNKRRVNTASNHINQIKNMNNNPYVINNIVNNNNCMNNNYNINNKSERPKT